MYKVSSVTIPLQPISDNATNGLGYLSAFMLLDLIHMILITALESCYTLLYTLLYTIYKQVLYTCMT